MIERITDLPEHVLGFEAKGKVTAEDYHDVIVPAIDGMLRETPKLRAICHFGEAFSGFEAAALWEDAKVGMRHPASWERLALVSDVEWMRHATQLFKLLMPGHVKVFGNDEMAEAREWVCGNK